MCFPIFGRRNKYKQKKRKHQYPNNINVPLLDDFLKFKLNQFLHLLPPHQNSIDRDPPGLVQRKKHFRELYVPILSAVPQTPPSMRCFRSYIVPGMHPPLPLGPEASTLCHEENPARKQDLFFAKVLLLSKS